MPYDLDSLVGTISTKLGWVSKETQVNESLYTPSIKHLVNDDSS